MWDVSKRRRYSMKDSGASNTNVEFCNYESGKLTPRDHRKFKTG